MKMVNKLYCAIDYINIVSKNCNNYSFRKI